MKWKPKVGSVVILAAAALAGGCSREVPEAETVLRPVLFQQVESRSAANRATYVGVARAGVEADLSFRVGGTVESVRVDVGEQVSRGQILAVLDPTDYELRVEEAEAAVAQAVASSRRAQADYDRTRALYEANNASKSDFDAARAAAESAEAQVEAGAKQLEQARQQLGYSRLRSPSDGVIARVGVEVNENVSAGQGLFLLTSGAHPEVRVAVPEVAIGAVERGQPVTATFDALPGQSFAATVSEVAAAALDTPTFEVTVRIDSPGEQIRSGMAADVTFELQDGEATEAIFLAPVAIGEDHRGNYVYVIEASGDGAGVARRREVEVGEMTQNGIEVRGVEVGELVATAGVRRLVDGMEVSLVDQDPWAAP